MRKHYDFSKAKRGPLVTVPRGTTCITISIDDNVLAWFKARVSASGGGSYVELINAALRDHIANNQESRVK
jgi:uncharacterized protein (DUF4415 family)